MTEKQFNILEYGAIESQENLQTAAIQKAIEACKEAGGGRVVVPKGTYLIGSLQLYSNITLYLETGAVLQGSKNYQDYEDFKVPTTIKYLYDPFYIKAWNLPEYYFYALITAYGSENVKVIGEPGSIIDGVDTFDANGEEKFRGPMGVIMSGCQNVELKGYTFVNSANWSHTLDGCDGIKVTDLTLKAGHDGFNLHHSKNIEIKDCHLETGDDCFAGYDIENLLVSRCNLNTACNTMRVGGKNLRFEECSCFGPGHYPHISEDSYYTHAIFKFYSMDADDIKEDADDIVFSKWLIDDADRMFSYDFGKKELMQNHVPLRNLTLENVKISNMRKTSWYKGNGEAGQLTFRNAQINHTSEEAFLEYDSAITLVMENVDFIQPTTFIKDGQTFVLSGNVSGQF